MSEAVESRSGASGPINSSPNEGVGCVEAFHGRDMLRPRCRDRAQSSEKVPLLSYGCFSFLVPALLSSHSPVPGTCPNLRVAFPALDSPPCQRCLQPALNLSCLSLGTGRGSECGPGAEPGLSSAGAASAPSPNLNSGDFMESQHH